MSVRMLSVILATTALLLSMSWWVRTHLATQNCEEKGLLYEPGQGCIAPPKRPPIIIERGLKRT